MSLLEDALTSECRAEAEHWKWIAAYLASCHAANLEGLPKSASKSTRKRHVEICRKAAAYLRGSESPRPSPSRSKVTEIEVEILRCEKAVEKHS